MPKGKASNCTSMVKFDPASTLNVLVTVSLTD